MPKKKTKAKKEAEEEEYVEAFEYEKYCDIVFLNRKRGMFVLCFGQTIFTPPKLVGKIWMDARALKNFYEGLQDYLKGYEKEFGKIK